MKLPCIHTVASPVLAFCMVIVFSVYSGFTVRSVISDCINHGDVTLNGLITASDAQQAFYIVLGLYSPTYEEECAADCNGDDDVSAADAQAIFLVVLGLGDCVDPLVSPTPHPGDLFSVDPIVGNMRFVPAGTFTQGSPDTEPCRDPYEGPQFTHNLTKNIAVMETEVSRQMWSDLNALQPSLPDDPSTTSISPTMNHPVQQNTWYESVLFANLLSLQNGFTQCYYTDAGYTIPVTASNYTTGPFYCDFDADGYRLATEGEWEYFARAGTSGPFSCDEPNYNFGNCGDCLPGMHSILEKYCVYCANNPDRTEVVGNKLPNPWNLKDVHGNVFEWCWDLGADYPAGPVNDYVGPDSGSDRVFRGGCWYNDARYCRSAIRCWRSPSDSRINLGFRLMRIISS